MSRVWWLLKLCLFSLSLISLIASSTVDANQTKLVIRTKREVNVTIIIVVDTLIDSPKIKIQKYFGYEECGTIGVIASTRIIKLTGLKTKVVLPMSNVVYLIIPPNAYAISPETMEIDLEDGGIIAEGGELFCQKSIELSLRWVHLIKVSGYILADKAVLEQISHLEFSSIEEEKEAPLHRGFRKFRYSVRVRNDQNYGISLIIYDDVGYPWEVADEVIKPDSIKDGDFGLARKVVQDLHLSIKKGQKIARYLSFGVPFEIKKLYLIKNPREPLTMENHPSHLIEVRSISTWDLEVGECLVEAITDEGIFRRMVWLLPLKNCPKSVSTIRFHIDLDPEKHRVPYSLVEIIRKKVEEKVFEDTWELYSKVYPGDTPKNLELPVVLDKDTVKLKFSIEPNKEGWSLIWTVGQTTNKVFDLTNDQIEAEAEGGRGGKFFFVNTTIFNLPFKLEASYSKIFPERWGGGGKWGEIPGHLSFILYQAGDPVDLGEYFE